MSRVALSLLLCYYAILDAIIFSAFPDPAVWACIILFEVYALCFNELIDIAIRMHSRTKGG
ncbi:MAG: hypothetical protein DSO07_06840 [Thermoproteota archaeon]|jgi:hypothetical protein|uniref:Uncharacterized protein n=1 Tax=Candidatus Methanodesulfokora washburnensis TaxID=2478471 RepID=A0A3R9PDX8_9CREN|nr:hypothetical protein [Candidatus Methanodesulfokores washburnensis]RSN73760.1 hypothetical protein D6D85_09540 [Candidatus Methanodesulfokores washburnensis]RZN60760.1 MAG: hypothetical protein EF810_05555 [Candidatus Methanodesulfokores washburnensis]TDA41029.1 MAG: hypothetical protein DSO07_06840 [Candidatus Korarchaeota archaeon]